MPWDQDMPSVQARRISPRRWEAMAGGGGWGGGGGCWGVGGVGGAGSGGRSVESMEVKRRAKTSPWVSQAPRKPPGIGIRAKVLIGQAVAVQGWSVEFVKDEPWS